MSESNRICRTSVINWNPGKEKGSEMKKRGGRKKVRGSRRGNLEAILGPRRASGNGESTSNEGIWERNKEARKPNM